MEWIAESLSSGGWLYLGIALLLLEFVVPGLFLFFFGIAALVVSLIDQTWALTFVMEANIFFGLSLLIFLCLRKRYKEIFTGNVREIADITDIVGQQCIATSSAKAGRIGKVEFRGASWKAISEAGFAEGDTLTIVNKENITLVVKKA